MDTLNGAPSWPGSQPPGCPWRATVVLPNLKYESDLGKVDTPAEVAPPQWLMAKVLGFRSHGSGWLMMANDG